MSDLLGFGKKARTINDVTATLARLNQERETAARAVSAATQARSALLLEDGSDDRIAELDRVAVKHRLTLERAGLLESKLLPT